MARLAVFRCDASPKIGGGHVTRCLALAEALKKRGWEIIFAVLPETVTTIPFLSAYPTIVLQGGAEVQAAQIGPAMGRRADWLVVDHNALGLEFESSARAWAERIFTITDFADRRHDCDLLLDQTIGRDRPADRGLHEPFMPAHCRLLLGAEYALVRDQFASRRGEARTKRSHAAPARRLLMSFGATDPWRLSEIILASMLREKHPLAIDVVTGIRPSPELVALAKSDARVSLHHAVDDMASLMLEADLCAGLAGTSAYERCVLGLPAMLFVPSEHYREISLRLHAAGVVELAGGEHTDGAKAARALMELAADPDRLSTISSAAFSFCDGNGAARIAALL